MQFRSLVITCAVLSMPCSAIAQQDMERMQECMQQIDQAAMQELAAAGNRLAEEARTLCAAGKRDEAQDKARAYGAKTKSSPVLQQIRDCGMNVEVKFSEGSGDGHICDQL